jgi:conflict system STAND superfamily ATPase/TIR domain-containing protein
LACTDLAAAHRLFESLQEIGADVAWFDKSDLKPGDDWEEKIRKAINGCYLFLPLVSANTEAREEGFFREEWILASKRARRIQGRKFIVPVVVDRDYDGNAGRFRLVPEGFFATHFRPCARGRIERGTAGRADAPDPRAPQQEARVTARPLGAGTLVDAQNPWPGLSAFDEGAQDFFNGRDAESAELLRLVGQAPLTVLFGKSGLGKTSLVQAGLFPRLRQQNILPVYIRLDMRDRTAPLIQQAAAALQAEIAKHGVDAPHPTRARACGSTCTATASNGGAPRTSP